VKSSSATPSNEIGKKCFGYKVHCLWVFCWTVVFQHKFGITKNLLYGVKPNCLYQIFPIDVGGAPNAHQKSFCYKREVDCLHKTYEFCFLAKILSERGAQWSDVFLNFFCLSASFASVAVPSSICVVTSSIFTIK
jgi:hypothetical protein